MIDGIGLYVHVPFCVRKCNYCDFCSFPSCDEKISSYVNVLCDEIRSYKKNDKIKVNSVFFGGGTPSVLPPDEFSKIFDVIKSSFDVAPNSEITIEVNPGTVNSDKLDAYKSAGVNRLSIGMQTIHENELKILGRIHTYKDFTDTFNVARAKGFDNINVDIMYGIPEQSISSFNKTLDSVIAASPEHISCYGLILEEGTPFFELKNSLRLPSEDEECDMYELAHEKLLSAGYAHYEISNYAKPQKECAHNLKYWKDEEYIGVGLAAHSYFEGKRFANTSDISLYLDNFGIDYRRVENSSVGKDPFEYIMLALRLKEGFSLREYEKIFSERFEDGKELIINRLLAENLIKIEDERLSLTHRGFYLSNYIITELV